MSEKKSNKGCFKKGHVGWNKGKHLVPWIRFNCKTCGHFFWTPPCRKFTAKVCSAECQLKYLHKKTNKRQFIICAICGKKKKVCPAEIKAGIECCSRECQSKNRIGSKNPNWHGGTSREPYSCEFNDHLKEEIRMRDNNTCQYPRCGLIQNGRKFIIHHIDYNKKNTAKIDLITLCFKHNSQVNSNREYWQSYFQNLQEVRLS